MFWEKQPFRCDFFHLRPLTYTLVFIIIKSFFLKKSEFMMKNINLMDAPAHRELRVLAINAGEMAKKRLISMGLHIGDMVTKYNGSSWCPVLLKNITLDTAKIAIGRKLAEKIMVEYENT